MADIAPLMWAYKFAREIARRMPHFRGEPPAFHPAFSLGGAAAIIEHAEGAIPFDAPRIVYSEEDEAALEKYVRATGAWLIPPSVIFKFNLRHLNIYIFCPTNQSAPRGMRCVPHFVHLSPRFVGGVCMAGLMDRPLDFLA
jgi:hypothetical protein